MKKKIIISLLIILTILIYLLYLQNYIPHKEYYNDDFYIEDYISKIDMDNDGIDDQTDILNNAKEYIKKKPKYKSKYYSSGYPDDNYGVCTDVVAYSLRESGYDLMELVNADINENREDYDIKIIDKNIDFRRVTNLRIYLENNAISLTKDTKEISEWQGGDIVVFKKHIGIISNKRNKNGTPFVIHHANPLQINYEEDILENRIDITGHYRIS